MIRTIQIEGFKSIASQTLELGRVNCFIGANGVGKSNILEAIGILGAAATGRVDDESLLRRGVRAGTPRLFKTAFAGLRVSPHITLSAEADDGAKYKIALLNPLEDPEPAWSFKTEKLSDKGKDIVSRGVRSENLTPTAGLAALRLVDLPSKSAGARLMQGLRDYSIYCPNTPTLRGIIPDTQTRSPVGLSGGRLAEAFEELMGSLVAIEDEAGEELYFGILELLDWVDFVDVTNTPGSLLSPSVSRGRLVLRFTDRFMNQNRNQLTAYDASEGALYVLFSAILCLAGDSPQLIAVDNLDQALNPRLITRLTERLSPWLQARAGDRQLLFTAHNPAVLDGLDLTDDEVRLFAVDRNSKGHTSCRRIQPTAELLALNSEYPLSRLWLMGRLGAVPNV